MKKQIAVWCAMMVAAAAFADGLKLGDKAPMTDTKMKNVDGKEVSRNSMEHATPVTFPEDETFDIGADTRTGVAMLRYRYDVPFKFTGTIDKLTFKLTPFKPESEAAPEPKAEMAPMEAPEPDAIETSESH